MKYTLHKHEERLFENTRACQSTPASEIDNTRWLRLLERNVALSGCLDCLN